MTSARPEATTVAGPAGHQSSGRWRLFIGLPVPDDIAADLWRALAPYRAAYPDARWTDRRGWHLTLLFLGSVEPGAVDGLTTLVDDVAAASRPFDVRTGRHGGRVPRDARAGRERRPRRDGVAWLGIGTGAREVIDLATRLAHAHAVGDEPAGQSRRTPSAHLTVARRVDERLVAELRDERRGRLVAAWRAEDMRLYRSHPGPGGSTYEVLHQARLGHGEAERPLR